ncbi:MAG: hypothetical protein IT376_14310, partial [Polyangiaceae bacterium]|nr:hypothetical protein [Polyangiaceae bacterium]
MAHRARAVLGATWPGPLRIATLLAVGATLASSPVVAEPHDEPPVEVSSEAIDPVLASEGPPGGAEGSAPAAAEGQRAGAPMTTAGPRGATDSEVIPGVGAGEAGHPGGAPATIALPTGADKTGVSSQAISVPQGAGKIDGMGESFSAQLSTGIATFQVPFALPAARGAAQPSLALAYSSGGGLGAAGMGWDVGVASIARQTDRGVPRYDDRAAWHSAQDRFVFGGGQELVPICTVGPDLSCAGALAGVLATGGGTVDEEMPVWAAGWQYFRPRVEGSFLRFFWSPDHRTWRVQDKAGVTLELGVPLDGSGDTGALERNPDRPAETFRWHLARQYDTYGAAHPVSGAVLPHNVVVYRYASDGGAVYLSDIFHTTPAAAPATTDTRLYAHHVRLAWESRTDSSDSYRSGWKVTRRLRLARVDVTSRPYAQAPGGSDGAARRLVRRYHLTYDPTSHVSLLASVQAEGRCGPRETDSSVPEEGAGEILAPTSCERLPPMTFTYSRVDGRAADGSPGGTTVNGYEPFDLRIRTVAGSPPHSLDEELTDLFDVNGDALPDVLVTAPGAYGGGHGVFFAGAGGAADTFGEAVTMSVGLDGAGVIKLSNANVAALDLDADGVADLLHMPQVKTYSIYRPLYRAKAAGVIAGWHWEGRNVATAGGQSPKIDFGRDGAETRVVDVNADGLVDIVVTTGTEMQTFFSLGRHPGGDGQFGNATWTTGGAIVLSNEPVRTCVPWSATPVRFSDPDLRLADLNGDGLPDLVRVRRGDLRYWPGRGNGVWGTGARDDCPAGSFGADRHVMMDASPYYSDVEGTTLRLDDVNGDGLDDLVQVRLTGIDVWLNAGGIGWAERVEIAGTPPAPPWTDRVRLVDVNGSGTRDVLWGTASDYRYVDLAGGARPHLLTGVSNGLGKRTALEYSTSTEEMMRADAAHGGTPEPATCASSDPWQCPWARKMPVVVHVVKRVSETDQLEIGGRGPSVQVTEYEYRDPVYDGRQREFRGFERARVRRLGDDNGPTEVAETRFLLGECADEDPADGVDPCAVTERWRDEPREALKGLPVVTEVRSEAGVYASTRVHRYALVPLYTGLDGRAVRHAFERGTETFLYDTTPFVAAPTNTTVTVVNDEPLEVELRASVGRVRLRTEAEVDLFGNRVVERGSGCVEGCARPDEVLTAFTLPGRPAGDPTGWLWRTVEAWAEGDRGRHVGVRRGWTETEHNPLGAPVVTRVHLAGTLPVDRFHASGADVAPPPGAASTDGQVTVVVREYDSVGLGNVVRERGAEGRCRDVTWDPLFAELPIGETIYTGGCGVGALGSSAEHDRGLRAAVRVVDARGQPTAVEYDAFGRLVALTRPHPEVPGELSPRASLRVTYFLPPDLGGRPYSMIRSETQDGATLADDEYLESWSWVDGMGRARLTLTEADPDPEGGDGHDWVAGGLADYDAKGSVRRKYLPFFYDGSPAAFPLEDEIDAAYGRQRYDAFGRSLQIFDVDGTVTLETRHHALSSDLYDAADREPGPHQGTFASELRDGHGRTLRTTERIHRNGSLEGRHIETEYLPTGEPEVITRKLGDPEAPTAAVTRWLRYDTLGRLVLNVEPHVSRNFDPDPDAVILASTAGDATALRAWRYAYDDAGELVGTSDARGCGSNYAYDA